MIKSPYVDIGANLTDAMYQGIYNEKHYHEPDLKVILGRAEVADVRHIIVTAGTLEETKKAIEICEQFNDVSTVKLYTTLGVHPTRANNLTEELLNDMFDFLNAKNKHLICLGEFGLDFERENFCPRSIQMDKFKAQLDTFLPKSVDSDTFDALPLFLHCRGSVPELVDILKGFLHRCGYIIVHSFDDTIENLQSLLDLSDRVFIGLNGCSLRSEGNVEMVKKVPLDRMLIETDAPWCGVRKSHACFHLIRTHFEQKDKKKYSEEKFVKGRNEPAALVQIAEIISSLHGMDLNSFREQIFNNVKRVFPRIVSE